ncbi:MAG: sulfotransferase, partial [Acidimicrobiales bacterium]|nr:sulfotransferase [Acidimicrobiales bacterium]
GFRVTPSPSPGPTSPSPTSPSPASPSPGSDQTTPVLSGQRRTHATQSAQNGERSGGPAPTATPTPTPATTATTATTATATTRLRRSGAGAAVTAAGKRALRTIGMATAGHRPGPDLLVVGAKRGGTTSLWRYLDEHPGMLPTFPKAEKIKGTYFFDERWSEGERWYRSHFPTAARRTQAAKHLGYAPATFEASPYYLFHPHAPARAKQVVPDALIVAILRDPVERAFSHWKERRNHTEDLSFVDALAAEEERTAGEESRMVADPSITSFAHRHQTYVAQSRYAPMLERWIDAFGPRQVIVLAAEEFYADPQVLCDDITDRLGLPQRDLGTPEPFNAEPSADMDGAVRQQLTERLSADIEAVELLLGRSMPWSR